MITVHGQTLFVNPPGHQSKKQKMTLVIHSWTQAYSTYAAALISAEETLISKPKSAGLLAHMYNVMQLARDLGGNQWVQYDKAFSKWVETKEVGVWGNLICQSFASVWQLNRDQHPSLECFSGSVIHHTQESLGGAGRGILRIPQGCCFFQNCYFCQGPHKAPNYSSGPKKGQSYQVIITGVQLSNYS